MARTKQEVRDFLNSQVGQKVNAKAGVYNGQCVSLIKALLEFLGVDNPYGARGNAKDVGDTLLRQGIATNGGGWLVLVVNRSMGRISGVTYGHIWIDLAGEANYEQNGARALHTTKNTRPIQHGQQFVNLDKYLAPDRKSNDVVASEVLAGQWGNGEERKQRLARAGYDYGAVQAIVNQRVSAPAVQTYTVRSGDNLSSIASRNGTTWQQLYALNRGTIGGNPNVIKAGQVLRVR